MNNNVIVIIINYNQSIITIDCIESVLTSNYQDYNISLIDNGSKTKDYNNLTTEYKDNRKVSIYRIEKNCGYVGGVNFGLEKASLFNPDFILIMNNDTIIDKNAIFELVRSANDYKHNAIVSGKIYHFDKPDTIQYTGSFFTDKRYLKETYPGKDEKDIGQCDKVEKRDMLDDIMWLLPIKIYKNVGTYSTNFFLYAEQADYALQAVRKGYELIYTPFAKIWHKGGLTTGDGNRFAPHVNYWRNKSSVIYLHRNIKRKYFLKSIITSTFKLIIKNLLSYLRIRKGVDKKAEYSALIGRLHGIKWVFNKCPDSGYNPFLSKE